MTFDTTGAACVGETSDLFFPEGNGIHQKTLTAKAMCKACPLTAQCLNEALVNGYEGIWGGTTAAERRNLKRGNVVKVRPPRTEVQIAAGKLANSERQRFAAQNSIQALTEALRILGDDVLPDTRRLVELRLARPDLSTELLGQMMDPPMNKDMVTGRLRRLPMLARKKR